MRGIARIVVTCPAPLPPSQLAVVRFSDGVHAVARPQLQQLLKDTCAVSSDAMRIALNRRRCTNCIRLADPNTMRMLRAQKMVHPTAPSAQLLSMATAIAAMTELCVPTMMIQSVRDAREAAPQAMAAGQPAPACTPTEHMLLLPTVIPDSSIHTDAQRRRMEYSLHIDEADASPGVQRVREDVAELHAWSCQPVNLSRPIDFKRALQPLSWQQVHDNLLRYMGYCLHVRKVKEQLLGLSLYCDGDLLIGYMRFLMDRGTQTTYSRAALCTAKRVLHFMMTRAGCSRSTQAALEAMVEWVDNLGAQVSGQWWAGMHPHDKTAEQLNTHECNQLRCLVTAHPLSDSSHSPTHSLAGDSQHQEPTTPPHQPGRAHEPRQIRASQRTGCHHGEAVRAV